MTIKTKLRKAAAALTALCLIAGCTTKPKDPEVYIDDRNRAHPVRSGRGRCQPDSAMLQ